MCIILQVIGYIGENVIRVNYHYYSSAPEISEVNALLSVLQAHSQFLLEFCDIYTILHLLSIHVLQKDKVFAELARIPVARANADTPLSWKQHTP